MSELLSFAVRLVVFSSLTYVGSLVIPAENELPITRSMRLSLAALQVAVICATALLVLGVRFLFGVVFTLELKNEETRRSSVDDIDLSDLDDDDVELRRLTKVKDLELRTTDGCQSPRNVPADEPPTNDALPPPEPVDDAADPVKLTGLERALHETRVAIRDAESSATLRNPTHLVTPVELMNPRREDSPPPTRPVLGEKFHHRLWRNKYAAHIRRTVPTMTADWPATFSSEQHLSHYILKVQLIGLALWQTFLCFDCTARDIDINFIIGIVTGWLCWCIANESRSRVLYVCVTASTCLVILFTEKHMLFTAVVRVQNTGVWSSMRDVFNMVVLPFSTGVFWTLLIPCKTLVIDVKRSLVTFILISLSLPLYWTVIDQALLQTMLSQLPTSSIVTFLLVEPLLKCASIFVMIVSVKLLRMQSLVVALVLVVAISNMFEDDLVQNVRHVGVHIAATCLLAVLQLLYIACSALWQR